MVRSTKTKSSRPSKNNTRNNSCVLPPLLLLLSLLLLINFPIRTVDATKWTPRSKSKLNKNKDNEVNLADHIYHQPPNNNGGRHEQHLTFAGKILPILKRFVISRDKAKLVLKDVLDAIDQHEFMFLCLVGWGSVPLVKGLFKVKEQLVMLRKKSRVEDVVEEEAETEAEEAAAAPSSTEKIKDSLVKAVGKVQEKLVPSSLSSSNMTKEGEGAEGSGGIDTTSGTKKKKAPATTAVITSESTKDQFKNSYLYNFARHIADAAQIGSYLYLVDILAVTLNSLGFKYKQQAGFSKKAAKVSYTIWASLRFSAFKRFLLNRTFRSSQNGKGRARMVNRILNVLLMMVTGGFIFDMFDINFGVALKSLLTFGGMGTLIFTLASKDFASELVSGFILSGSDRFFEGDELVLGDGTSGIIARMGMASTDIRGYDEIVTRIPNSQLANQRVRNLSRVNKSQVKQTLWFSYKDINLMPNVTKAITTEIKESCPDLITDGSRPFRAHWREFKEDHLEVVVDCHFTLPPKGDVYWNNREQVLLSIARAVGRLGVRFTLPSQICTDDNA